MRPVLSATLAINEIVEARQAAGEPVLNLGFGEARLPVPPAVAAVLAAAAPRNRYAPVAGSAEARAAAAGYFTRRGLPTTPGQIALAPGSKPLLYALVASLPGDIVLPRPSWVSYAAQAALAGRRAIWVDAPEPAGGVPDPDRLEPALSRARKAGLRPGVLILTLPDNPTGTVAPRALVERVCAIAAEHGLAVVSDEIYRDLCYDPADFHSPAGLLPEATFVTSGLSKNMALGGWRIGFARFPDSALGERTAEQVTGVASEVWSCLAEPMQEVATFLLSEPPEVVGHVGENRRLHQRVTTAFWGELVAAGARCQPPRGGFYLYPDLAPLGRGLARQGVRTGADLARHLLDRHGVAVLAGDAFGDDPARLRVRMATSLLHGDNDGARREALHSPDPLALPWIGGALDRLRGALAELGR